jgi:hypothetical protein
MMTIMRMCSAILTIAYYIYAMYQEDSMGMQGFSPGLSSGEVLDPMPEVNFPLRLCSALKYVCTLLCDPPILTVKKNGKPL